MSSRRTVVWVDYNGFTRATYLTGNNGGGGSPTLASVESQLLALSNADEQSVWEGPWTVNPAPAPAAAVYQAVGDYAALTYQNTGTGELVYITLPAPKSTIFLADGETVDPTAIAALTTEVTAVIITASGAVVDAFVGGVRRARLREYQ